VTSIIEDLMHPFRDPREHISVIRNIENQDQKFTSKELLYCMINESERTFREGFIVQATVIRVFDSNGDKGSRIFCKLPNGLDANILDHDADALEANGG